MNPFKTNTEAFRLKSSVFKIFPLCFQCKSKLFLLSSHPHFFFCSCFQPGRPLMRSRFFQIKVRESECKLLKSSAGLMKSLCLTLFVSPGSSSLGPSALKAAAASTKRKDTSTSLESRAEKKKKSALEEIMEVEAEKWILSFSVFV